MVKLAVIAKALTDKKAALSRDPEKDWSEDASKQ
jgi:hypothetical protein